MKTHAPIELKHLPFSMLRLAPNPRPRESISADSIQEIANSILEHGIIQPVLARMQNADEPEVYAGQRRFLGFERALEMVASGEAEARVSLETVPCLVSDIDDRTMREQQWIENLQRQDVHPRDEVKGYAELVNLYGYTAAEISRRIGKQEAYVSNRLVLVNLPDVYWKAWEAKKLTISHLEVAGSIPGTVNQEEFARRIMGGEYDTVPMTVREAQELKGKEFIKSLRACGFDKEDADLVTVEHLNGERVRGGACEGCPFKVGSAKAPQCANVACFATKQDATWHRVKANAEENGRRIMDVDQTSPLFDEMGELIAYRGWVDLGSKPGYLETGHYNDDVATWEDLLAGTQAFANAVMARHPKTNRIVQLLERAEAIRMAEEADEGNAKVFEKRPGAPRVKTTEAVGEETGGDEDEDEDEETGGWGAALMAEAEMKRASRPLIEQRLCEDIADRVMQRGLNDAGKMAVVRLAFEAIQTEVDAQDIANLCGGELGDNRYPESDELWAICEPAIVTEVSLTPNGWLKWLALLVAKAEMQCSGWKQEEEQIGLNGLLSALEIDRGLIREQVIQGIKAKEEPEPKEKLVSCAKCGRGNFTERGLKAHVCKVRDESSCSEVGPWVDELMTATVEESQPNENGVFTEAVLFRLEIDKKSHVGIYLAQKDGQWIASSQYRHKDASGTGLPRVGSEEASRMDAVGEELGDLLDRHRFSTLHGAIQKAYDLFCVSYLPVEPARDERRDEEQEQEQERDQEPSEVVSVEAVAEELGLKTGKMGAIDEEVKAKARALYDGGMGKDKIAKELGISPNTVGNWQKREWPKRVK
jgi:ParB/RepB/Spo0J family partition protein